MERVFREPISFGNATSPQRFPDEAWLQPVIDSIEILRLLMLCEGEAEYPLVVDAYAVDNDRSRILLLVHRNRSSYDKNVTQVLGKTRINDTGNPA